MPKLRFALISGLCLLGAFTNVACLKSKLYQEPPQPSSASKPPQPPEPGDAPTASAPRAAFSNYVVDCNYKLLDLSGPVREIADSLEALNLMYSSREQADCSGMVHRVLQALKAQCESVETPSLAAARSAEGIARWYAERRELILIHDALAQADLIKPGAVLFFGQEQRVYRNLTAKQAFKAIYHVGIVVAVEHDAEGRVVSYKMFQGRSPGKPAATTNYHWRQPSRPTFPAFGNGEQQWIAFARLCSASSY